MRSGCMVGIETVARQGDVWACDLRDGRFRVTIQVADPFGGRFAVAGVFVSSEEDGVDDLTASLLRDAPLGTWIRAAKDAVARVARPSRLVNAGDAVDGALKPFLENRQGTNPRTD